MTNPFYMNPYYLNGSFGNGETGNHGDVYYYNHGNMPYGMVYTNQYSSYPNDPGFIEPILNDHGKQPFVLNIHQAATQNNTFRTAIWTGDNLQVTLMSIGVGEDIGLEVHPDVDQFLRIEEGQGLVQMGVNQNQLNYVRNVYGESAIMVPAGVWHNLTNTGNVPLKLYTVYAPPEHPFGTVHRTKADEEG